MLATIEKDLGQPVFLSHETGVVSYSNSYSEAILRRIQTEVVGDPGIGVLSSPSFI